MTDLRSGLGEAAVVNERPRQNLEMVAVLVILGRLDAHRLVPLGLQDGLRPSDRA